VISEDWTATISNGATESFDSITIGVYKGRSMLTEKPYKSISRFTMANF
jgi:hypothetical protein